MEITNRLTKLLSKHVASDDDLRPAMQGILVDGPNMMATNGHILTIVEGDDDSDHFADPAIYRIDEKQSMNADFVAEAHDFINEQFPKAHSVLPQDEDYVYHEVKMQVEVLEDLLHLLKGINSDFIHLKFPEDRHKAIVWEGSEPHKNGVNVKRIYGVVMPMQIENNPWDLPLGNIFNNAVIDMVKNMVDSSSEFLTNNLKAESDAVT